MSGSKHFDKIVWTITALMLAVTILFMNGAELGIEAMAHTMGYENRLFDNTRVHTVDIVMNDWEEFIANAASEEYYAASVVIDNEAYKNVGIRGKGNTSLSTVASMDSDRYSFKIEFDRYDSSMTYHGLDKLSLNNLIQDSTMMKDYLTYTMMKEFDVNAPLCSFVYITVNGEDWGLYLAVEGVEDAFLERNYGSDHGKLYKPDNMSFGGGRGNGKNFDMEDFLNREDSADSSGEAGQGMSMPRMPDMQGGMPAMGDFNPAEMFGGENMQIPGMQQGDSGTDSENTRPFGGRGGFGGRGSSDVKLQYIDDNADSYSNIWNNAKTAITESDQIRLMESLNKLSKGEEIESAVDIEQVIRYFVVHNYVCNGDSYTGSMVHNYYLYEEDGRMAMIPWDYNLAFGTFQGGSAQSAVNTPIDSPVDGGTGEDRPMWNWIAADSKYTELYHQYFAEFLNTVDIPGIIDNAYNLVKPYVKKDPTAFYTYEEFETGVETLRRFCSLRSESISMQLENGETASSMSYVDASGLTLSDMGSMRMGGGMPNMFGNSGDFDGFGTSEGEQPGNAERPGSSERPQMQGGFGGQMPDMGKMPEGLDPSKMPGGNFRFDRNGMGNTASGSIDWIWIAVSVLILCAGMVIAKKYKR